MPVIGADHNTANLIRFVTGKNGSSQTVRPPINTISACDRAHRPTHFARRRDQDPTRPPVESRLIVCDRSLQVTLLRQASPQLKSARQRARDRASPQSRSAMLHRRNDSAQTGRCPVHLRVGKRGLDRQRCLLLGHRACQVTRLCELVAEVVARISIRWPRWECATVMRDGLGRPAILSEHNAKVVVGDVRHAVELQNPTPQHLGVLNDSEQREKRLSRMRPRLLLPRANGVAPSTRRKRCRAQPRSSRRTSATVKESSTAAHRAVPGRTARPTSTDRTRRRTPKLPVCRSTPAEAPAAARRPTTR